MSDIVGIKFKTSDKTYCFKAEGLELKKGDRVVVESEHGINIGLVAKVQCGATVPEEELKPVLRKVTQVDLSQEEENEQVKREAKEFGNERIVARNLPMKLLSTDVTLDRKRFTFYFVADTRIDFRELVKDLASKFRTRIELRQIGVRDAAKVIGGFGICGREFCCSTFLKGFAPISIKMAKQQDLVLNTCKLSGQCGRLMCCLNYEYYPDRPVRRKKDAQAEAALAQEAPEASMESLSALEDKAVKEPATPQLTLDDNDGREARVAASREGAAGEEHAHRPHQRTDRNKRKRRKGGRPEGQAPQHQTGQRPEGQTEARPQAEPYPPRPLTEQGAGAPGEQKRSRHGRRRHRDRDRSGSRPEGQTQQQTGPRPEGQQRQAQERPPQQHTPRPEGAPSTGGDQPGGDRQPGRGSKRRRRRHRPGGGGGGQAGSGPAPSTGGTSAS